MQKNETPKSVDSLNPSKKTKVQSPNLQSDVNNTSVAPPSNQISKPSQFPENTIEKDQAALPQNKPKGLSAAFQTKIPVTNNDHPAQSSNKPKAPTLALEKKSNGSVLPKGLTVSSEIKQKSRETKGNDLIKSKGLSNPSELKQKSSESLDSPSKSKPSPIVQQASNPTTNYIMQSPSSKLVQREGLPEPDRELKPNSTQASKLQGFLQSTERALPKDVDHLEKSDVTVIPERHLIRCLFECHLIRAYYIYIRFTSLLG